MSHSLETKFNELENKYRILQKKYDGLDSLQQKFSELQNKYSALNEKYQQTQNSSSNTNITEKNVLSGEFWQDIYIKIHNDPDYVKSLIKNKVMTLNDVNKFDQNLLHITSKRGSYELAQFCLNWGSDITKKDEKDKTALDYARENGNYDIEQLLLFSQMNVNIGNEIKNTADIIHKQNGINYNILNELSCIGEQSKELFEKILMELMVNVVTKRLSFSDTLLNLCWNVASRDNNNALSSDLWKAISTTCSDIIQNGSKRDWYWLKTCVIPSTIWFKNISKEEEEEKKSEDADTKKMESEKESHYLYYELLKLVDIEAKNQLNKLEQDLNELADEHKNDWNKLTKWDLEDEYENVRQDVIPNGIVSRYTYNQLSESSGATFNSPKFYDYNQYLSQLVLLAQIVDDEYQRSAQNIFKIDKVTHVGTISFDNMFSNQPKAEEKKDNNDVGDGKIKYMRGPVKLIERARTKAQNDYAHEEYPASACVLDLNRCALIFNDIPTLLAALQLFVNKVKYYQSGNIIGIVRDKNGFIEYIQQPQYADIKLNVLIKGKHNNLIGEVQFLLKTMKEFKDKAHNLYSIQRQQESIETSVNKVLPMLLDEDKQLFIAGNQGDVKSLCKLMVINNKSTTDIMKSDELNGQTILHCVCSSGRDKAFVFLKTVLPKEKFIECIFKPNELNYNGIEYAVRYSNASIIKNLFEMKEIRDKYKNNDDLLFRLLCMLFAYNRNEDITDYVLSVLNISNNKVIEMMEYKYPKPAKEASFSAYHYHRYKPIVDVLRRNNLDSLKKLVSIIGEKTFINGVLCVDDWNINGFEAAIAKSKIKTIEYILSFKEIKDQYINGDDSLLFRLMYFIFVESSDSNMIDFILSELGISKDKIIKLLSYQYPKPMREFGANYYKYHNYRITSRLGVSNKFKGLTKLQSTVGEKALIDDVFNEDGWNQNAIEMAIDKNRVNIIKHLLSFKELKDRYNNNNNLTFRLIYYLFVRCKDENLIEYILKELNISNDKIKSLITYRCPTPTKQYDDGYDQFHLYSIIGMIAYLKTVKQLKYIQSKIGEDVFIDGVFHNDGWGDNAILCAIQKKQIDTMQYLLQNKKINKKCIEDNDKLYNIISNVISNWDQSMAKCIINHLKISEAKLKELKSYRNVDITNLLNIINQ